MCCSIHPTEIIPPLFKTISSHSGFHSYTLQLDTFINGIIAQYFIGRRTVFKKVTTEEYVNKSVLYAQYIGLANRISIITAFICTFYNTNHWQPQYCYYAKNRISC